VGTLAGAGPCWSAEPASDGKALYFRYCASCHGAEGRGDGPDAVIFSQPPRNLRGGWLQRYPVTDLVQRVLRGQPLWLGLDPGRLAQRAREVEELAEYLERLPKTDWDRALRGWDIYAGRCAPCHGSYGKPPAPPPGVRGPRDLAGQDLRDHSTEADVEEAVRHGRRHMPALTPRVTDAEAKALRVFVGLLSPGFESYERYCAGCHGNDGQGVRGTLGETTELPAAVFDVKYFLEHPPAAVREKIWHMVGKEKPAMPHYRSALSEAEAKAIVEYLRTLG
jgi:mono/diheme cytochrome c family protein